MTNPGALDIAVANRLDNREPKEELFFLPFICETPLTVAQIKEVAAIRCKENKAEAAYHQDRAMAAAVQGVEKHAVELHQQWLESVLEMRDSCLRIAAYAAVMAEQLPNSSGDLKASEVQELHSLSLRFCHGAARPH